MSGTKGRSGGARSGAGSPRRNLKLDKDTALKLSSLTKQRRALQPNLTEEDVVRIWALNEWNSQDKHYQECAEKALEG